MKKQPKILITDDMQIMRRLLKSSLIKAGFNDIEEAANGEELLKKLDTAPFDIIICDWDMPRMTGIDALHLIRSHETHKDIPFIMVTAVAEAAKIKQAIDAGISDYIVKPIKPDQFADKVRKILVELGLPLPVLA